MEKEEEHDETKCGAGWNVETRVLFVVSFFFFPLGQHCQQHQPTSSELEKVFSSLSHSNQLKRRRIQDNSQYTPKKSG